MSRTPWLFISVGALALAAACSGGGSSVTPNAGPTGGGSNVPLNKSVTFTVLIPKAADGTGTKGLRRSKSTVYVSPNTQSISIQLGAVNGLSVAKPPAPTVGNVPASCVGSPSGCTVTIANVPAAAGSDTFVVTTFSGQNATGAVVSEGVVPVTVSSSGGTATVGGTTLSLGGFVSSLALSVHPSYFLRGHPSYASVVVVPKDATGAIIIGNTQFAEPILLEPSPTPQLVVGGLPFINGVATLSGPQSANQLIELQYNGSSGASVGQLIAKSVDATGLTISAAVTVDIDASTPPPTPSPTPSGYTPPPKDLYVLNGEDNSIVELPGGASPQPTATPVRTFGGYKVFGCKPALAGINSLNEPSLGASGLTADSSGNTYAGNGLTCSKQAFYAFGPTASGTATPSATYLTGGNVEGNFIAFYADPSTGYIDESDGGQQAYLFEYLPSGSGATLIAAFGALGLSTSGTCILTPGIGACTDPPSANTFLSSPLGADLFDQDARPFALDGAGNYLYPAKDSTLFNMSLTSIPINQVIPVNDPVANAPWLRGINTFVQSYKGIDADRLSNYPAGMAVDGHMLYVLNAPFTGVAFSNSGKLTDYWAPAATCNASQTATPSPASQCSDGTPHEYLTAYDLSKLTANGPNDLEPVLVVGGNSFPGGAAAGGIFGNRLVVSGGNIYIADPAGLSCNAACFSAIASLGKTPVGQISVYPESLTGVHIDDSASSPTAIITGPNIKFPTGIAAGLPGSQSASRRRAGVR